MRKILPLVILISFSLFTLSMPSQAFAAPDQWIPGLEPSSPQQNTIYQYPSQSQFIPSQRTYQALGYSEGYPAGFQAGLVACKPSIGGFASTTPSQQYTEGYQAGYNAGFQAGYARCIV
jgi:hypothetical protein